MTNREAPSKPYKGRQRIKGKVNGYIKNAVQARYEADTGKEIDL